MSEAAFARLWADEAVTVQSIADQLGVCRQAVSIRAKVRGLPPRKGRYMRLKVEDQHREIGSMWLANVGLMAMAEHFRCSHTAIIKAAARLGLPKRDATRWSVISVADFRSIQFRDALAARAREEQAALWNAEMVDGDPRRRAA